MIVSEPINPDSLIEVRRSDRTSQDRAVVEVGGWYVPRRTKNPNVEACIAELVQLQPRAISYPFGRSPGIGFVESIPGLEFLRVTDRDTEASCLSHLKGLRGFSSVNGWEGALPLESLPLLRWLGMQEPPKGKARQELYDQKSFSLRHFRVVLYPFADLWPLVRAFPNLEYLSIGRSPKLVSLDGIQELASLRTLELFNDSKLDELGPLTSLNGLEALSMESVRAAADLNSVRRLESLRFLNIDMPKLESIKPLSGHPNLKVFTCYAAIGDLDWSPLDSMLGLKAYSGWLWKLMPDDSSLLANGRARSPLTMEAAAAYRG